MAGQALRQMREKFLRARIQPVNILYDEQHERRLARAKEEVAEHAQRPLLELSATDAIQKLRRGGQPEEMRDQNRPILPVQAHVSKSLVDALADLLSLHSLGKTQVSSHELRDGTIGHRAVIGPACRFQLDDSGPIERAQELVEQPRLSDARLPLEQHDGAAAIVGPGAGLAEPAQRV